MTNPMIPAEAVEAAANVLWDKEMNAPWSSVAEGFKAPFLRDARAALEAAAPYMQAAAREEGLRGGRCPDGSPIEDGRHLPMNPYGNYADRNAT